MRYDFEHLFFTFVLAFTTFRKALEVSEGFFKKQLEQDREQNTAGPNQKKAHFSQVLGRHRHVMVLGSIPAG